MAKSKNFFITDVFLVSTTMNFFLKNVKMLISGRGKGIPVQMGISGGLAAVSLTPVR